jgi:hypothetical protein
MKLIIIKYHLLIVKCAGVVPWKQDFEIIVD